MFWMECALHLTQFIRVWIWRSKSKNHQEPPAKRRIVEIPEPDEVLVEGARQQLSAPTSIRMGRLSTLLQSVPSKPGARRTFSQGQEFRTLAPQAAWHDSGHSGRHGQGIGVAETQDE